MSSASIKRLALLCMVLDHIAAFIPGMPIQLRWIGRISAPLFMYVFVNSIDYTRDRDLFIRRVYGFNVLTSIITLGFNLLPTHRAYMELVTNNILGSFTALFLLIDIIEQIRNRETIWKRNLLFYVVWQIFTTVLIIVANISLPIYSNAIVVTIAQISGNLFYNEGRFVIVLLGVVLYYTKNSKRYLTLSYSFMVIFHSIMILGELPQRIYMLIGNETGKFLSSLFFSAVGYDVISAEKVHFLWNHFEWMMMIALPIILLYNGKKGKSSKYFYYIFYPLHLFVLLLMREVL